MAVIDPRYGYEDLLAMPDDGNRHELVEGDLLVSPVPNRRHQRIVWNLVRLFGRLEERGLGQGYVAPFDVVLDWHTVFEPDVLFIRTERLGIVTERNVSGAPDLVVEVLSESTRDVDLRSDVSCAPTAGTAAASTGTSTQTRTRFRSSAGKAQTLSTRASSAPATSWSFSKRP